MTQLSSVLIIGAIMFQIITLFLIAITIWTLLNMKSTAKKEKD